MQIIDDQTNTDDAKSYRLVMVGRKVSAEEQGQDRYLKEMLSSEDSG